MVLKLPFIKKYQLAIECHSTLRQEVLTPCEVEKGKNLFYIPGSPYTHMDISQGPIALLWSKMAFFKRAWRKVKVLSRHQAI